MKRILLPLLLLAVAFTSCKKDNPEPEPQPETPGVNPTPTDPYAANLALINPGAEYYLIADVSGIPGVTKINWQLSTVPGSKTDAFNGVCNGNEYHTGYIVGHDVQPDYFWFVVFFQTTASTGFNNLVHTGDYDFCTPADPKNGVDISFLDASYYDWRCRYVDNNALQSSNFKVTKMETTGGETAIEARFNCQLKRSSTSAVITLSNAVFRAHWSF
jgi:hypothetical protein